MDDKNRKAIQKTMRALALLLEADGRLQVSEAMVLLEVALHPGEPQTALRRAVGKNKSTTSRLVKNLKDAGLVTQWEGDDDARERPMMLTPQGQSLMNQFGRAIEG